MSKKPLYNYRQHILPARIELANRFPAAFKRKGEPDKVPLKIGIADDVIALVKDIPRAVIKRAIGDYCSGPKYARAMIAGAQRIDLEGKPDGFVTADQEAFAKAREKRRLELNADYLRKHRPAAPAVEAHA